MPDLLSDFDFLAATSVRVDTILPGVFFSGLALDAATFLAAVAAGLALDAGAAVPFFVPLPGSALAAARTVTRALDFESARPDGRDALFAAGLDPPLFLCLMIAATS